MVERLGATYKLKSREPFVTKGKLDDFRPFSLAVSADGASFYLVDWAFSGWLADGPRTGRLFRLSLELGMRGAAAPAGSGSPIEELGRPELSAQMRAQRELAKVGAAQLDDLAKILRHPNESRRGIHAVWALDAAGTRIGAV